MSYLTFGEPLDCSWPSLAAMEDGRYVQVRAHGRIAYEIFASNEGDNLAFDAILYVPIERRSNYRFLEEEAIRVFVRRNARLDLSLRLDDFTPDLVYEEVAYAKDSTID